MLHFGKENIGKCTNFNIINAKTSRKFNSYTYFVIANNYPRNKPTLTHVNHYTKCMREEGQWCLHFQWCEGTTYIKNTMQQWMILSFLAKEKLIMPVTLLCYL